MSERLIVKARGLPWSATSADVVDFFSDCSIVGGEDGIKFGVNRSVRELNLIVISYLHWYFDREGRPSGEAFVEFESAEDVQKAMEKDRAKMGKRYIEIFESHESDMERACPGAGGNDQGNMSGFSNEDPYGEDAVVKLRGLPFDAGKFQIAQFFKGLIKD